MSRTGDLASGAVGVAFAVAVSTTARAMPMGTIAQPGAGFLPFWTGVALGIMSLGLIVSALRADGGARAGATDPLGRRRVAWVLGGLLFYGLSLDPVGFLPTTFVLLAGLVRILGQRRWLVAAAFSLVATAGAFGLFAMWLGVPLPRGQLWP